MVWKWSQDINNGLERSKTFFQNFQQPIKSSKKFIIVDFHSQTNLIIKRLDH